MSSSTNLLLPLYHICKPTKYFGFYKNNLIVLLLLSTVFSLYVILNHLPSNQLPSDLDSTKPPQDKKELDRNAMRQEKVKNVSLYV